MTELEAWAERAWQGDLAGASVHPGRVQVALHPLDGGMAFQSAFSNALVLRTEDGLAFVDTSSLFHAQAVYDGVRAWTQDPVRLGIYTHGHVDHVFGLRHFHAEAEERGAPPIEIWAHRACPARFDRYQTTNGYNAHINQRQFGFPKPVFPREFRYPDRIVDARDTLEVGGVSIELFHDKGETDDALWAWLPERRALYTGDFFIWASPNCGNPQKVQRYPVEWAAALRKMAALAPEQLFPGHGPPIFGAQRVAEALGDAAALLESLVHQTLDAMNAGANLDEVLRSVVVPRELLERPYLRPVYDDPIFVVRGLWRLYGGWYDGDPSHLLPPGAAELAGAIAQLAGGASSLAEEARRRAQAGELALASALVEYAWQSDAEARGVRDARAEIYARRAQEAQSLMAKGIFRAAVRESRPDDDA
ncbi:MAG: alkyl sulfatase dimerization domain-containing protein [Myxococcota bacterium]